MLVVDVLKMAATQLGFGEGVEKFLDGKSEEFALECKDLLACYNLVENELALDYFPLTMEETVETDTGAVYYKELSSNAVRVFGVRDEWGNSVKYKIFPEYVLLIPGKWKITYNYAPREKSLADEVEKNARVSKRTLCYGIAAQYCLLKGDFELAAVWTAKYKEAIAAAFRSGKMRKISSRRWV